MLDNNHRPVDFSDFLLDDEFVDTYYKSENKEEYINTLKSKFPQHTEDIDLAISILSGFEDSIFQSSGDLRKRIWDNILARRARARQIVFLRIAASLLLIIGIGAVSYNLYFRESSDLIKEFLISHQPAFDQSRLILSDGQQVAIKDYDSKIAYSDDGSNIVIDDTTEIVQEVKVEHFNQLIVPFGKYNRIQLSDGTNIWVNSGSRLVYPPVFSGKAREVYIQGEAYFEVSRDETRPFYVKTDRFRVKVTGTKFNVQTNERDGVFTTLLLEGEVSVSAKQVKSARVQETKLLPGQLASLSGDNINFEITPVEYPENYIAWVNGYLVFNEEPLNQVLQRVGRFYNIPVEYKTSSRLIRISGKLDLKEEPERVLRGIATIARAKYHYADDTGKHVIF